MTVEEWRTYFDERRFERERKEKEARGWQLADVRRAELPPSLLDRLLRRRRVRIDARFVRDGWPLEEWR